jgi:hypothetical protein
MSAPWQGMITLYYLDTSSKFMRFSKMRNLEMTKMKSKVQTRDEMKKFVWDILKSGLVIPGYVHAVLKRPDPRYLAQR